MRHKISKRSPVIKKSIKAIFTVTAFTVATRVLSFIFKIYLSRTVGAEVIGLYHIALSIFGLLACITASGLPMTLSRKTAEYESAGKAANIPTLVSSCMITGVTFSIAIVGIIFLFRGSLDFLFSDPRALPIFLLMLPALISTSIYGVLRGWFWGKKDFTAFSIGEFSEEIFRIIFTVLLAGGMITALKGETGLALAFTVSDIACAIVLAVLFVRNGGTLGKPGEFKNLLKSSTPITAMRVFSGLVASLTAIIIPARLTLYGMNAGEATAAFGRVVGLAFPVILIPIALTSSIIVVLIPEVSGQNALGDIKGIEIKTGKAISISVLIAGLFLAIFSALGREIGIMLYDDVIAGEFIRVGAWLMVPIVISQITSSLMNSLAMETKCFANYVAGTVILLAMIYVLPKYIGIYALIAADGAFYAVTLTLNTIALLKKKVLSLDYIGKTLMALVFAVPSAYLGISVFGLFPYETPLAISAACSSLVITVSYLMMAGVSDTLMIEYFFIGLRRKRTEKAA